MTVIWTFNLRYFLYLPSEVASEIPSTQVTSFRDRSRLLSCAFTKREIIYGKVRVSVQYMV